MPFKLDEIASRDITSRNISIKEEYYTNSYNGKQNAEGVYWFSPVFYRGLVEPTKVGKNMREGLEHYLKPTETLDSNHRLVIETAYEIKKMVGIKERNNAYLLGEATAVWIKNNIKSTLVPHRLINHMASNIKGLEDKKDDHNLLRDRFNNIKKDLKRLTSAHYLQKGMGGREIAKELMTQVDNVLNSFQSSWTIEELKASKTLEEQSSKCVGIANTYVALLRAMGVPSRVIEGYAGNNDGLHEGGHAWATLYIPEFGWKEADPTWGEYANFSFNKHAYNFFSKRNNSPIFYFIGEGESNLKVNEAINLIETKRKEGISKKGELMKKVLEYLKRFQ